MSLPQVAHSKALESRVAGVAVLEYAVRYSTKVKQGLRTRSSRRQVAEETWQYDEKKRSAKREENCHQDRSTKSRRLVFGHSEEGGGGGGGVI